MNRYYGLFVYDIIAQLRAKQHFYTLRGNHDIMARLSVITGHAVRDRLVPDIRARPRDRFLGALMNHLTAYYYRQWIFKSHFRSILDFKHFLGLV